MALPETSSLAYSAATHPGLKRAQNEDRYSADPDVGLFAVVDGVGGHAAGQVASETAASVIETFVRGNRGKTIPKWPFAIDPELSADANCLRMAILLANRTITQRVHLDPALTGMAATLSAALTSPGHVVIANVGDCRVYSFRDGELVQMTRDHSWVAEQVRSGALKPEEARVHPMRNLVTRAVAGEETLDIDIVESDLLAGDVLLLCSDGLHGPVPDATIRACLAESGNDLNAACERLLQLALAKGGPDNITVLLVQAGPAPSPPST